MAGTGVQPTLGDVLAVAGPQHRVICRAQLRGLGMSRHAIAHRVARGRLFAIHRGVYAVGTRDLTREGEWMAAVLACGEEAVLSHQSAAALWRVGQAGEEIEVLDRHTLVLTHSELERPFVPIARRAGLPPPLTQQWVNGERVDFYWPELGLVVETDGLRYHRTPGQQAKDRHRDHKHIASGLTPLRFTHAQVAYEPAYVELILRRTAARLR